MGSNMRADAREDPLQLASSMRAPTHQRNCLRAQREKIQR
jgi:hypothetical protein